VRVIDLDLLMLSVESAPPKKGRAALLFDVEDHSYAGEFFNQLRDARE
jgi:hypothetical protein